MGRGGDVAVVGARAPLQVIDARDLGSFIVRCAVSAAAGTFDGVGPWAPLEQFLSTITPPGVETRLLEVDGAALEAAGASLPLLSDEGDRDVWMARPGERATAAGLVTRPLPETADATRAWDVERGEPQLLVGPTPEVEAGLLGQCGAGGAISV
jgi:hypothetical protein